MNLSRIESNIGSVQNTYDIYDWFLITMTRKLPLPPWMRRMKENSIEKLLDFFQGNKTILEYCIWELSFSDTKICNKYCNPTCNILVTKVYKRLDRTIKKKKIIFFNSLSLTSMSDQTIIYINRSKLCFMIILSRFYDNILN